jgi:hypothetical protein
VTKAAQPTAFGRYEVDGAVLAAVTDWRYIPAQKNGVKVRTRVRVLQAFGGNGELNSGLVSSKVPAVLRETEKDLAYGKGGPQ